MNKIEQILALEKHKDNISKCTSFEQFKSAQIEYISFLIEIFQNEVDRYAILTEWNRGQI